jgi:hypothetical protein
MALMKLLLLFILFICAGDSFSQDANVDRIPISYYILTRPLTLEGEIIDYRDKMITVSIKSILKDKLRSKKLKIRINYSLSKELNGLGLETNQSSIFILGKRHNIWKNLLYQASHRLKVQNDSLFIPDNNLRSVDENNELNIHQKNTFNDPLFTTSYKISIADFSELISQINETFQYVANGRRSPNCILKLKEIDSTTTLFNQAVINHLEKAIKGRMCD